VVAVDEQSEPVPKFCPLGFGSDVGSKLGPKSMAVWPAIAGTDDIRNIATRATAARNRRGAPFECRNILLTSIVVIVLTLLY
jgi:hypothetical protein